MQKNPFPAQRREDLENLMAATLPPDVVLVLGDLKPNQTLKLVLHVVDQDLQSAGTNHEQRHALTSLSF